MQAASVRVRWPSARLPVVELVVAMGIKVPRSAAGSISGVGGDVVACVVMGSMML